MVASNLVVFSSGLEISGINGSKIGAIKNNGIVCVVHHIQDQSETTLFKLARGSEVDKLAR